jgi:hypothetical protein
MMLAVTLALLFFPLSKSLIQVRDESIARTAVREAQRQLGSPDAFLSQQLDILPDRILASMVSTTAISPDKVRAAERYVIARTGKATTFSVRQVASQDEIARLRAALTPPPAPPPPQDLESIRNNLLARMEPLMESWPSDLADLESYELGFGPQGITVTVHYTSRAALDEGTREVLTRVLRKALETEGLEVVLEREPVSRSKKAK